MINETIIRVRYQETDKMGVVYNGNYLTWFEIGRTEFFRELGLEYSVLEKQGVLVPVVDVRCQYRSPAKYDDEVVIQTKITEIRAVKIKFEYQVLKKTDKKLLAIGYTIHAFTSRELKIINIKKAYKDIYEKMLLYVEES